MLALTFQRSCLNAGIRDADGPAFPHTREPEFNNFPFLSLCLSVRMVQQVILEPTTKEGQLKLLIRVKLDGTNEDVTSAEDKVCPESKEVTFGFRKNVTNGDFLRMDCQSGGSDYLIWEPFHLSKGYRGRKITITSALYGLKADHKYSLTIKHPQQKGFSIRLMFR